MTASPIAVSEFPPGPSALGAMRGMRALGGSGSMSRIPVYFASLARRYGGIAHWKLAGTHFYFVDDPASIEEAFVFRERDYLRGRGIQRLKRILGDGLLSSEEPLHLRQRRLMAPAFHRDRIDGYGRQMVAATAEHIARWQPGGVIDINAEMASLTLGIAAQTLFRADVGSHAAAIRTALETVMETFPASISRFSELLDLMPFVPATRRFEAARSALDTVVFGLIADRRADPATDHDDLLGMLLAARDDDGSAMDDRQVRDEALTLLMAGHETTANALAWTWYLLARYPAVARRIAAEVDAVVGDRRPDPRDVPALRFTRDVLREVMRLYPPAWILGRRALRATAIGTYAIPAGSVVLASQLVTHRNPRYWDDPDTFVPDRWAGGDPPLRYQYFPFGGGGRRCIGEAFAWMEGILLIATIAQRFSFVAADVAPVGTDPTITLRPAGPIRVRATEVAARHPGLL